MTNFKTKSDLILTFSAIKMGIFIMADKTTNHSFGQKYPPHGQRITNYVIYRVQMISQLKNVNLSRQSKIVRSLYLTYLFFIKLFHTWQFSKIYEFQYFISEFLDKLLAVCFSPLSSQFGQKPPRKDIDPERREREPPIQVNTAISKKLMGNLIRVMKVLLLKGITAKRWK